MQTIATGNMRADADYAGTHQQPSASQLSAASPQLHGGFQLSITNPQEPGASQLPAVSPHWPGVSSSHQPGASQLTARNFQQPGPSQLTATEPDTSFPVWSESDVDDELYAIGAEDEMGTHSSSHMNKVMGVG